jgi:hypothetical protein
VFKFILKLDYNHAWMRVALTHMVIEGLEIYPMIMLCVPIHVGGVCRHVTLFGGGELHRTIQTPTTRTHTQLIDAAKSSKLCWCTCHGLQDFRLVYMAGNHIILVVCQCPRGCRINYFLQLLWSFRHIRSNIGMAQHKHHIIFHRLMNQR